MASSPSEAELTTPPSTAGVAGAAAHHDSVRSPPSGTGDGDASDTGAESDYTPASRVQRQQQLLPVGEVAAAPKKRRKHRKKQHMEGGQDHHVAPKAKWWANLPFIGGHGHGPVGPDKGLLEDYHVPTSKLRNDFRTIDWYWANFKLGRVTRQQMLRNKERRGCLGRCENAWLGVSTWVVLLAVGITVAINAVTVSLTASWVSGLKNGVCVDQGFWSTRDVCCAETSGTSCPGYLTWAHLLQPNATPVQTYWLSYFCYVVMAVAMAEFSYWLVHTFCLQAAGSGIPEVTVIMGGFIVKKYLDLRVLIIKTVALAFSVGSGMSAGKEGPLVQIGCCWGMLATKLSAKYSKNEVKKREILSAAAAAGVAAAFGAPLGGVLFSLESVSSYFPPKTMWRSFWCTISVVLFLKFTDPFGTGKLIEFEVDYSHEWKWFEIFPFALVGCIGGVMGGLFVKCVMVLSRYKRVTSWVRGHPAMEVGFVALGSALFNYTSVYTRGSSTSLLADLFADCSPWDPRYPPIDPAGEGIVEGLCSNKSIGVNVLLLFIAGFGKWFLTIFTFTLKVPAGVFIPAMASGALFGRGVGWIVQLIQEAAGNSTFPFNVCAGDEQCISPSVYAVLGSAAMLGGITRMTIALAVIMFELTGGLQYILPLMIALVWAKWTGDWTQKGGIYTHLIAFKGYPHLDQNLDLEEAAIPAESVMSENPICLTTYGQTISSIHTLLNQRPFHGFPIVNNMHDRFVHGYITRVDLEAALFQALREGATPNMHCHFSTEDPIDSPQEHLDFSAEVDEFPVKVLPTTPADKLLHLFRGLGLAYTLVVNRHGVLVGIVKKKDFCTELKVV